MSQENLKYKTDTLCPVARLNFGDGDEMRAALFGREGTSDFDLVRNGLNGYSTPMTEEHMTTAKQSHAEVRAAIIALINTTENPGFASPFKLKHIDLVANRTINPDQAAAAVAQGFDGSAMESRVAFAVPGQQNFAEIKFNDADVAEAGKVAGKGNAHLLVTARINMPVAVCAALARLVAKGYTLTAIANANTGNPTMTLRKGGMYSGISITLNWIV